MGEKQGFAKEAAAVSVNICWLAAGRKMKVNYEPNPSSAIIIKRKKGLSVSNQQLKVNIFCWALFDPFTFEDSMKEGAQLMFSKNYEDKAWPCNQIKSCLL